MDSLLSPCCTTEQQQNILTQVLTRLKVESHQQQWREKQNAWNSNYAGVLVELIGRLVWVCRTQAQEQLKAEVTLLCQALQLLQGLLLLHRPSAQLFERKSNIEILLYLLNHFSQSGNAEVPILVLDTFLCILADRPKNIRAFEEYDGVEQVVKLLRSKTASKPVRIKCLEVLYFYLLPESSPATTPLTTSFPSTSTIPSSSPNTPGTPNTRTAMDGLKSLLERTETSYVPRTPRKARPVSISGTRKATAIHIPSEPSPSVPAILRSGSENTLHGKEGATPRKRSNEGTPMLRSGSETSLSGKEQIPPTPRSAGSRINSRSNSNESNSATPKKDPPLSSSQKTPVPSSKKTAALSSAPRLPGSTDSPFLATPFVPGHKSSLSEPTNINKRNRPPALPLGSSTNLHAFDTPPLPRSSLQASTSYATPPMSAASTPRSDRSSLSAASTPRRENNTPRSERSANALSRSRAAREQFSPRKSAVHAKPPRLGASRSERSTSGMSDSTFVGRKPSDEKYDREKNEGKRTVEEKKLYLENHLGNVDDLMGNFNVGLGLRGA